MIKKLIFISKLLILMLSSFIILMAFDCFSGDESVWYKIACFLISCSPGLVLLLMTWLLRKKHIILGIFLLASAVFLFIFFHFYEETMEKLLTIATVILPLVFSGVVFILSNNKYD